MTELNEFLLNVLKLLLVLTLIVLLLTFIVKWIGDWFHRKAEQLKPEMAEQDAELKS